MRTIAFPDREVGRLMALGDDGFMGHELAVARGAVVVDGPVVLRVEGDLAFLRDLPARAIEGLAPKRCEDPSQLAHAAHLDLLALALPDALLGGAALEHMAAHRRLERLDIGSTRVTDAGLLRMPDWPKLRSLVLTHLPITDASVASLAQRTSLRALNLGGTKITPEGFFVLRAALPHCDVIGP